MTVIRYVSFYHRLNGKTVKLEWKFGEYKVIPIA